MTPRRPEADFAAVAAVVLAAGFSSRMGAFKPLLPFGGRTLIGHVAANLREAGVRRIHVVTGFNAEALAEELKTLGAVEARNPNFAKGMFSSVQAGVASLPAEVEALLLSPVDVPLLRASSVARILRAAASRDSAIVYPTFRGERGHPPLIRRSLFDEILSGDGEGGLQALLARHEDAASEVAVFDWGCLIDMDRRDDHRLLAAALAGRRAPDPEECEAMLEAAAAPEAARRHGRVVAALAVGLARRLKQAGVPLDADVVDAAARLHDIAKGRPRHAEVGAEWLRDFGFPEIADAVAVHMDARFDGRRVDERVVVHLADKLVQGEERVSLETRFAPAMTRFADNPAALAGAKRRLANAQAISRAVEARIGPLRATMETGA
jgi:CTP:molybdopterin cytidylyltransferase MocA